MQNEKGITLKIFCITSILLVSSALIIYLTLYFLLSNYYYNYKKASLSDGTSQLVEKSEIEPN
ncbi:hypothetical protein KHA80_05830 [Anaerobacillus sp. HL2]|nr:hypothetical protein KHA80_05830 [Anaerobacillus sp. HL2]